MHTNKDLDKSLGEFFGYPLCCVNFYCRNNTSNYWYKELELKYPKAFKKLGKGFIPCEKHLFMMENGENPKSFIKNRKCKIPYGRNKKIGEEITKFKNNLYSQRV